MDIVSNRKSKLNRDFELALKESSIDCVLNRYGNLIRLTEINDKITYKEDNGPVDIQYYLDESTGETYIKKDGKLKRVIIRSKPTRFGISKVDIQNKVFDSLKKYPLVSYENLSCNSKTAFEYEKRVEGYVKSLKSENEKVKLSPRIFNLLDNKKFKKCLDKTINTKFKAEFKNFAEQDKERKKIVEQLIKYYLKREGLEKESDLTLNREEYYRDYLYGRTDKEIKQLLSSYKRLN